MHFLKLFSREKSTQDKKVRLIKGNELKSTQVELLSFFLFKGVWVFLCLSASNTTQKQIITEISNFALILNLDVT